MSRDPTLKKKSGHLLSFMRRAVRGRVELKINTPSRKVKIGLVC